MINRDRLVCSCGAPHFPKVEHYGGVLGCASAWYECSACGRKSGKEPFLESARTKALESGWRVYEPPPRRPDLSDEEGRLAFWRGSLSRHGGDRADVIEDAAHALALRDAEIARLQSRVAELQEAVPPPQDPHHNGEPFEADGTRYGWYDPSPCPECQETDRLRLRTCSRSGALA
jgi:hypothetical protein